MGQIYAANLIYMKKIYNWYSPIIGKYNKSQQKFEIFFAFLYEFGSKKRLEMVS
jgi:hypothetical protein